MAVLSFTSPEGEELPTTITAFVIAGWAGRDEAAVRHHIEELAAIGVSPPSTVPLYYRAGADTLTSSAELEFLGSDSSGEAEAMIVSREDGLYVGLGSDHTDRRVEAYSVAVSKQMCAKPVARQLWRFDEVIDHWDSLELRSWITVAGVHSLYQEGDLSSLRDPRDLIERYIGEETLPVGTAMLCGTLGALGGIRSADRFEMELRDPVLNRSIKHGYVVRSLPVAA